MKKNTVINGAFPELIIDKPWKVTVDGRGARVDIKDGVLYLREHSKPSEVSHELAHVAWSPTLPPQDTKDPRTMLILSLEDTRINLWLRSIGVDMYKEHEDEIQFVLAYLITQKRIDDAIAVLISTAPGSSIPRGIIAMFPDRIRERVASLVFQIQDILAVEEGRPAPFERVEELAEILKDELKVSKFVPPVGSALVRGKEGPDCKEDSKNEQEDPSVTWEKVLAVSGTMDILDPPKDVILSRRRSKLYARDTGVVPRRMDRYAIDHSVFLLKKRDRISGTVLIDNSGSMAFTENHLLGMIKKMPFGTIAYYSGDGSSGTLVIAGKNGRSISNIDSYGRGNIIDAPAIKWLMSQPAPRYYIGDGGMTGKTDTAISMLVKGGRVFLLNQMKLAGVTHYGKPEELLANL